jgi:hypothetical protein
MMICDDSLTLITFCKMILFLALEDTSCNGRYTTVRAKRVYTILPISRKHFTAIYSTFCLIFFSLLILFLKRKLHVEDLLKVSCDEIKCCSFE